MIIMNRRTEGEPLLDMKEESTNDIEAKKTGGGEKEPQSMNYHIGGTISTVFWSYQSLRPLNKDTLLTPFLVMTIDKEYMLDKLPTITFSMKDVEGIKPHDDNPIVITVVTIGFNVKKEVHIDQGSSVNIMHWNVYKKMETLRKRLQLCLGSLVSFQKDIHEFEGMPTYVPCSESKRTQRQSLSSIW